MKKLSIAFLSLAACCLMQACNDSKTEETTASNDTATTTMEDTSSNRMAETSSTKMSQAAPLNKDDSEFVIRAESGGMMEVELGKLAQDRASGQRVKDFGNMMVTDHSRANDDLKSLASSKNITVPSALGREEQEDVDKLSKKSGADFDKAYMKMMLDDHKKDVAEFKKCSTKSKDPDIKDFTIKTLPVLQKHLDSAKAIESSKM